MRVRYYDYSLGRFISEDPLGFDGGDVNLYAYVLNNPVNFIDPNGLDAYAYNIAIQIPLVGGFELGIVEFMGPGIQNYDIGGYVSFKRPHSGLAFARATMGVSHTRGSRRNFDGLDAEVNVGLGEVGVTAGGLANNEMPNSYAVYFGPQIGYEVNQTATGSFTAGDVARIFARVYGDGGSVFNNSPSPKP
jgi:uncharacterized protein RhaS with RHS repeats